ncbi:hypothetical protein E2542_SST19191 [Spatholobus suberectus]|nr:hypothetical protein E2542_SST19191 [Spatholobus suberectus]
MRLGRGIFAAIQPAEESGGASGGGGDGGVAAAGFLEFVFVFDLDFDFGWLPSQHFVTPKSKGARSPRHFTPI